MKCLLKGGVDSPTEVTQLEHSKAIKDVFRFDVSVHNRVAVKILETSYDLSQVVGCLILLEAGLS